MADLEEKKSRIFEIDKLFETSREIWDDSQKAIELNKEKALLQKKLEDIEQLNSLVADMQAAHDLEDWEDLDEVDAKAHVLYEKLEDSTLMNGRFDNHSALVSIHAGAGGVDAQDFAAMLMSMYQAFCKNYDFDFKLLHISSGEEAGLKSASFEISGENAYGHLKEEAGVHRLIRLSPFNNSNTRETSFALVEVLPTNLHSSFDFEDIKEDDLKWDFFMSSGKGGQSVNTTYSAVRVTHIPTGISVSCQNERNQLQNKQQALKYLHDKLAALELKKQKDMETELKGVHQSIEWGSQIRSYTLHPYKLVKDHRSGWESSEPMRVLENGDILPIIWSLKRIKK
ncbi:peptide chain release factor 2 [Candidatus Gracilibacteria bacterium]|nr:peptide chain release factor 2 [Candidatus Gracilibacteria bacterium]